MPGEQDADEIVVVVNVSIGVINGAGMESGAQAGSPASSLGEQSSGVGLLGGASVGGIMIGIIESLMLSGSGCNLGGK